MKQRITPEFLEKTLNDYNLSFECFNNGLHYRIEKKCDFWPSTSRYYFLYKKSSGHGLQEMVNLLKTGQANVSNSTGNYKVDNALKEKNWHGVGLDNKHREVL